MKSYCVRDKGLPKVEAGQESIQGLSPPPPHPSFLRRRQGRLSTPPQRAAQVVHCRTAGGAIPVAYLMRLVGLRQSYLWAQVTNRFHLEHALLRQGTMINE